MGQDPLPDDWGNKHPLASHKKGRRSGPKILTDIPNHSNFTVVSIGGPGWGLAAISSMP